MKHDRLVLSLLQREVLGSLRSLRRRDFAWIILGGGVVIAYAAADMVVALHAAAPMLRNSPWLWRAGLPAATLLLGFFAGLGTVRLALSRAYAPFMKALPVSNRERRRMAVFAATCIGTGLAVTIAGFMALACALIATPDACAWAFLAAALFTAGFVAAMAMPLRIPSLQPTSEPTVTDHETSGAGKLLTLKRFDRARPTWAAAWAWNLRAGAVTPSWRLFGAGVAMGLAVLISVAGSLIHHQAAPGAVTGLAGGLVVFMLALRYHPLGSPVLRTAPIGFWSAWLRLLWLPLQLSIVCFLLPAGPALAAEPSSWPALAAGGLWLLILNGAYAVFAAYFMTTPLIAAFSFLAAIAYAAYESSEYGRTVVLGFLALVIWLFYRTRRRFYHG
jgi:hypothetical protein